MHKYIRGVTQHYDEPLIGIGDATWETLVESGYSPEESQKTQITKTRNTYTDIADRFIEKGHKILDYSGGLGAGALDLLLRGFSVDMYEPYYNSVRATKLLGGSAPQPQYTKLDASDVPNDHYDVVINNCVLNVVILPTREHILLSIYNKLRPGGRAYINILGRSHMMPIFRKGTAVGADEVVTSRGTFQKGYTRKGFMQFIDNVLPSSACLYTESFGDVSAIIEKPM